ncbi:MAG: SDR family oxidoreductase [Dehalococcoidia bacterium]
MKILVAGGAGYLGSVLVPQLIERGYEIDVVDLLWFGNHMPDGIKVIRKEIMTLEEKDLSGYDQVIFIAGLSNDPMAEYSPASNFVDNAALPAYLSYVSKRAGVKRFIYGCSCSVYGYSVDVLCDESALATSNYPYGISKLQGEFACLRLQDDKFSTIALRKGTVSGYSPRMRLDLIVNAMFKTAVTEKIITVNNPSIWRPILDVRDAASSYIRAVEVDHNVSGIFNIAYGNYTVGEVADYVREGVKEHLGITARLNIKHIEDFRNYKVTSEKARNVLSFNPRFNVKDTVRNLAENMDKFKDMENPKYYNIKIFKELNRAGRA